MTVYTDPNVTHMDQTVKKIIIIHWDKTNESGDLVVEKK